MLGIILGILKIAGIVLLVLLGILLTLILLVLFVPVRYRVRGAFDGTPRGMGEISWLLHLISCRITYEDEPDLAVRILGIRVGKKRPGRDEAEPVSEEPASEKPAGQKPVSQGSASEEPVSEKPVSQNPASEEPAGQKPVSQEPVSDKPAGERPVSDLPDRDEKSGEAENLGENQGEDQKENREELAREAAGQMHWEPDGGKKPETEKMPKQPKTVQDRPQRRRFFWRRFQPKYIWKKIRVTFQKICDKLKTLRDRWQQILEFLQNEENRQTFRNLKKQLLALLYHIRPRKLTGRLRFGFEDPFKTGQLLTYVSPFYGLYAQHVTLIPVFEEEVLEGELDMKGRIRLAALIWIGIQVIRDRNFRILLKKWNAV